MRKLSATRIHSLEGEALEQHVLILDEGGQVLAIEPLSQHDATSLEHYDGHLIPGFVNAHCHLELSHMLGLVDTGTGLIPFIKAVVGQRAKLPAEYIQEAIKQADAAMYQAGIVAVGDICNQVDTFATKAQSRMRYHSFVECFDFLQPTQAQSEFVKYKAVYDALELPQGHAKSLVPHAPYSVSPELFALINAANAGKRATQSIHNQETPPENQLFLQGTGDFVDFYESFGLNFDSFSCPKKTAIHYALQHLDPEQKVLFVHNSLTTGEDIAAAAARLPKHYWATCPNANLYIENRLPQYQFFREAGAKLCIGTDSLTSNWQLSVLEEMKTISRFQSYIPFEELLRWACINGAEALGFEADLGSFAKGKRPGVNLITSLSAQGQLTEHSQVRRLA